MAIITSRKVFNGVSDMKYGTNFGTVVVGFDVNTHAEEWSSDLRTSVSWLNDKVKGISKLRLNQDELGTASGQLNSAWRSVPVRTGVDEAERLLGQAGDSCGRMGPCEAKAESW
ncbi:hypothetical protein F2Q68_00030133 [Brassica cretica]|uniref:Uncharacterized protein n=1 Tax=Brassica cretica TaxID=69181 RepID=A0A8S9GCA1_BRACR|nr:hypothetical protein F2Q68_00030133 [Brassica cretica]